jgi:hypothetical protein
MACGGQSARRETKVRNFFHAEVVNKRMAKLRGVTREIVWARNVATHLGTAIRRVSTDMAMANVEPAFDVEAIPLLARIDSPSTA